MGFEYSIWQSDVSFGTLKGLVIISATGIEEGHDEILLTTECGKQFKMYHEQDCCESVYIDDVCGDVDDILNDEIMHAEERSNNPDTGEDFESVTYTFYDIQTSKGSLNIKWYGESNGYYSESVDFVEGKKAGDES